MTRVLGIDGGGTKTDWILLEDGVELRRGILPQGNLRLNTDEGLEQMFSVLPREVTHVGVFLAACATADDRRRLDRLVERVWPQAQRAIGSDRESALASALQGEDGIVVIGGTGAAVHGRRGERIERAGGWGHVVGDRGGGYDLARQALRLVLSHYDVHQQISPLTERILRELALNSLQDLAAWALDADKMSIARLAPAVFDAARQGEPEMVGVLESGAGVLAEFTRAVSGRLGDAAPRVCLFGGLFVHHEDYAALFKLRLSVLLPDAEVEVSRRSGALGAAWLAEGVTPEMVGAAQVDVQLANAPTEMANERSAHLDAMSTAEMVSLFIEEESAVAAALDACRASLVRAIDVVADALRRGGRLFYLGAGTSGRLGVLDASEIPPTFGVPAELVQGIMAGGLPALHRAVEGAEDLAEAGALAVRNRGVRAGDVVCGITASGRTPFVLGGLRIAAESGANTLLVTCNPSRTATEWDVEIDLPTGPEIVTGSTRLKAGTATKLVLNLISTAAMVRLGRVRGNRMIDLGISNEKLRDRGTRMVAEARGISYEEARRELERHGWNVRACLDDIYPHPGS